MYFRCNMYVLAVELPAAAIEQLADVIGDIRDRGYPDPKLSAPWNDPKR